ncbi:hypothetical protein [Zoogloea sp.]|uniref:hypothetical protein n=1 Tax=Zoogloea sp. TaxID=49181 RepID=UPI00262DBB9B|nr:hypothetical protein [Zoogloea sp.]
MRLILASLVIFALIACSSEPKDFPVTKDGIKTISASIMNVSITPQIDPRQVYVDVTVKKDPLTGGAQDWNSVADEVHYLASRLFSKPEVARVRISFKSPENKGLEWAVFFIRQSDLPQGWRGMNYLQFFSVIDPMPGALDASRWLCEFYEKYSSAMPNGKRQINCSS